IRDRDANRALHASPPSAKYYPIRFISPLASNRRAIGLRVLSVPISTEALARTGERARGTTQSLPSSPRNGKQARRGDLPAHETRLKPAPSACRWLCLRRPAHRGRSQQRPPAKSINGVAYCLAEKAPNEGIGRRLCQSGELSRRG
ncbi:MAG: CHASE domain-containing protein, partial [Zoogloea sp.]|nr:CHASE domain-containing protein [Zoogloea sp.]